ncbi:MAG: polyphosphate polymerase domain-containing protein [Fibrobacteria bacterium]
MKPGAAAVPMLERYELKYTIPSGMVEAISAFIRPYCYLDRYSNLAADGFYQVNSLYLDSPDFLFLRNRLEGRENRFNMRTRSYGEAPQPPYFLEVKQKTGDIIRKYRARVTDADLESVLDPSRSDRGYLADPADAASADLFRRLAHTYNAAPVIMTSYRRKAFISGCDEYARVTFDVDLRFMAQPEHLPLSVGREMAPSDAETCFDEGCSVVLELKCFSKYVPLWMIDLIRTFDLRRRSFSKYGSGSAQVFQRRTFDDSNRVSPWAGFGKD